MVGVEKERESKCMMYVVRVYVRLYIRVSSVMIGDRYI